MKGLIIGRFFPLHLGHCYLIDVALEVCDVLYIFLCSKKDEMISGDVRKKWLHESYPSVHIFHITKEIQDAHVGNPDAPNIWGREIRQYIPDIDISCVFASELYGKALALNLGAKFCMVDMERIIIPVSGSDIRENIYQHWEYLADSVKPSFVKIVCVSGEESKIIQTAEMLGALYIDNKKIISSEIDDEAFKKKIIYAKINVLKKQDSPLIIYKIHKDSYQEKGEECCMEDTIMMDVCDKQCMLNNDDDVNAMMRWWMSLA